MFENSVGKSTWGFEPFATQGLSEEPQLLLSIRDGRINMIKDKFSRHFMVVHTFVSHEARAMYCTPPEKREPKAEQLSEYQWAVQTTAE